MMNTILRLLTFKLTREEMLQFNRKHFFAGLIGTWVAGIGRYWDDDGATMLQHLGLGSVIYIFLLAAFIWLIVKPLLVDGWNYFRVLTFISLTSFPAIFYAIPVERVFHIETANTINTWFLAIVAAWRLALLFQFLKVFTRLHITNIIIVTLMPVCLIITALFMLNLQRVAFDLMGGRRNTSPHDGAYSILFMLTIVSVLLTLPLLMGYLVAVYERVKEKRKEKRYANQTSERPAADEVKAE
jgi:hypothetical protein